MYLNRTWAGTNHRCSDNPEARIIWSRVLQCILYKVEQLPRIMLLYFYFSVKFFISILQKIHSLQTASPEWHRYDRFWNRLWIREWEVNRLNWTRNEDRKSNQKPHQIKASCVFIDIHMRKWKGKLFGTKLIMWEHRV